ncbi:chorismate mutase [Roseibium sediminis]|uniref:chorismate mutase n=1 Tax=Roseibium sediminis TaxID=1775174 RepID=UPI00123DB16B|nr:chorismate mutase [Roseibium sediminis]
MLPDLKPPSECSTRQDIRTSIDLIDEELLRLFVVRQGYIRRMAELKTHPDQAFDAERIETMVHRLTVRAEELGLEGEQVDKVWRTLIDWNVAYEERTIAARLEANQKNASGNEATKSD